MASLIGRCFGIARERGRGGACCRLAQKNVVIIGDSLTIGYTPVVAELLADLAFVQHVPWDVSDGGAEETAYGLACLELWLASPSGLAIKVCVECW